MLSPFYNAYPTCVFYVSGLENVAPGLLIEHKPISPVEAEKEYRDFLRVRDDPDKALGHLDKALGEYVTKVAYIGSNGWTTIPKDKWASVYAVLKLAAYQVIVGASGASKIPNELKSLVADRKPVNSEEIAKK